MKFILFLENSKLGHFFAAKCNIPTVDVAAEVTLSARFRFKRGSSSERTSLYSDWSSTERSDGPPMATLDGLCPRLKWNLIRTQISNKGNKGPLFSLIVAAFIISVRFICPEDCITSDLNLHRAQNEAVLTNTALSIPTEFQNDHEVKLVHVYLKPH